MMDERSLADDDERPLDGQPELAGGRRPPRPRDLVFWAGLALAAALLLWWTGAKAADGVELAWTTPGGAAAILAAIERGYFSDEGLAARARGLSPEALAEGLKDGSIEAAVIGHQGLALAADGLKLKYAAGLYSGFVEVVAIRDRPDGALALAVGDLGGGPAVAAARWLRSQGKDPYSDASWKRADDPEKAVIDGEATAFARWELKRAHGHGHGGGAPPGHGHGEAPDANGQGEAPPAHGQGEAPPAHGHGEAPSGHGHGEAPPAQGHGEAPDHSDRLEVLFSASASLPVPDPDNPNPHAGHTSAHHLFEAFAVLGGDLAASDPERAAAITRALIRGAVWVGENTGAAADLLARSKAFEQDRDLIAADLARWMWMPGVSHAKEHLAYYIHEAVKSGALPADLDEAKFFGHVFAQVLPDLN